MKHDSLIDPHLTRSDLLVLKNLLLDIDQESHPQVTEEKRTGRRQNGAVISNDSLNQTSKSPHDDEVTIKILKAWNDPKNEAFEPTVFVSWDLQDLKLPMSIDQYLLQPYIRWAQTIVRTETDVLMLTHLILYFTTSIPSALYLYYNFSWFHGIFHLLMQGYFIGTYTLMMHQHIHMNGILNKKYAWFDKAFPYITDPLMGHTWNSYFYHHIKHHHVEANGPDDLSSTLRYQRDDLLDFLHYVGRFFFLIWLDLPRYFLRKKKPMMALKTLVSEMADYAAVCYLASFNPRATFFVFIAELLAVRVGLMVGNWGQHALVDEVEPDSDFRSSITLIDVASNRYCFNDGYHTSHHLNPRRHWREHPVAFLKQKNKYAKERALVFRNIDYIMMTVKLLHHDYEHLAKCLVPIGDQIGMSLEQIAAMLKDKTRRFTEEEIEKKFRKV